MTLIEGITSNADICHGQAVIHGTRIPVSVVLDNLAAGLTDAELITEYPTLTSAGIHAALAYAAILAREEIVAI